MLSAMCNIVYILLLARTSSKYSASSFTVSKGWKAKVTVKRNESKRMVFAPRILASRASRNREQMTAVWLKDYWSPPGPSWCYVVSTHTSLSAFSLSWFHLESLPSCFKQVSPQSTRSQVSFILVIFWSFFWEIYSSHLPGRSAHLFGTFTSLFRICDS